MNKYKYRIDHAEVDENKKAVYITIAWFETKEGADEYSDTMRKANIPIIRTSEYTNADIELMINKSLETYTNTKLIP